MAFKNFYVAVENSFDSAPNFKIYAHSLTNDIAVPPAKNKLSNTYVSWCIELAW